MMPPEIARMLEFLMALDELPESLDRLVERGLARRVDTLEEAAIAIRGVGWTITTPGEAMAEGIFDQIKSTMN